MNVFGKIRRDILSGNNPGKYFKYAIGEIALVVIGILIALQINNWNETNKDRNTEAVYLRELLEDFTLNLQKSGEAISRIEEIIPNLMVLLEQSALEKPSIPLESINKNFTLINSMPAYISTDRAYNNLIGSGEFKLITSPKLKTAIANYYKATDLLKLVQATHEMELVNSFQPYIIENLDFQAVKMIRVEDYMLPPPVEKDRILKVMNNMVFRNIITLKITILTDLLELNRNVEQINKELVNILQQQTQQ